MTSATRFPRLATTWSAFVGLTCPLALALGAASGTPAEESSACIARCPGTLRAIVSSPAVAIRATGQSAERGTTQVSGPGQKAFARARSVAPTTTRRYAYARHGTLPNTGI